MLAKLLLGAFVVFCHAIMKLIKKNNGVRKRASHGAFLTIWRKLWVVLYSSSRLEHIEQFKLNLQPATFFQSCTKPFHPLDKVWAGVPGSAAHVGVRKSKKLKRAAPIRSPHSQFPLSSHASAAFLGLKPFRNEDWQQGKGQQVS